MKVTFNGRSYECDKAIKGSDYIHLLNADGSMFAAFDGISDFSAFETDGTWTTPSPIDDCFVTVMGIDGVVRKSGHQCKDLGLIKEIDEQLKNGELGQSAYEIALKNGFEGSEEEWLESLKGRDGDPGKDGQDGEDGANITVKSTSVTYQASSSGTATPTGTWSATVPSVSKGQYLWTKSVVTFSDNSSITSYSVGYLGTNGSSGTSVTISSKAVEYNAHTSGTTAPTDTWSTTIPSVAQGQYLWTRTTVNYSDGKSTVSYSVSYYGKDGVVGKDGTSVSISEKSVKYASSTSGTTAPTSWQDTVPTVAKGSFLWSKTYVKYSDGSSTTTYGVGYFGTNGTNGTNGKDGSNGTNGTNGVSITSITVTAV